MKRRREVRSLEGTINADAALPPDVLRLISSYCDFVTSRFLHGLCRGTRVSVPRRPFHLGDWSKASVTAPRSFLDDARFFILKDRKHRPPTHRRIEFVMAAFHGWDEAQFAQFYPSIYNDQRSLDHAQHGYFLRLDFAKVQWWPLAHKTFRKRDEATRFVEAIVFNMLNVRVFTTAECVLRIQALKVAMTETEKLITPVLFDRAVYLPCEWSDAFMDVWDTLGYEIPTDFDIECRSWSRNTTISNFFNDPEPEYKTRQRWFLRLYHSCNTAYTCARGSWNT
jgi:hypothetical protein